MKVKLAFTAISEISPPGSLAVGCPPANPTKVTTIAFLSAGAGFLAFEEQKSNMLEAARALGRQAIVSVLPLQCRKRPEKRDRRYCSRPHNSRAPGIASATLTGKCERGKRQKCARRLVALVGQLRRRRPKGGQWSLRNISAETHAARLGERARASILCGVDCKRCSQRCRLRALIC